MILKMSDDETKTIHGRRVHHLPDNLNGEMILPKTRRYILVAIVIITLGIFQMIYEMNQIHFTADTFSSSTSTTSSTLSYSSSRLRLFSPSSFSSNLTKEEEEEDKIFNPKNGTLTFLPPKVKENPNAALVDRMYYFSSFANKKRHMFMEDWLSRTNVPYQRLEPITGPYKECYTHQCTERKRLAMTYGRLLYIGWRFPITDHTLVIDDDATEVIHLDRLEKFIHHHVPDDWHFIRLDCDQSSTLPWKKKWYKPHDGPYTSRCTSSSAILWRESGLLTLRKLIVGMKQERIGKVAEMEDLNCLLSQHQNLTSYCVNIGTTIQNKHVMESEPRINVVEYAWTFSWFHLSLQDIRNEMIKIGVKITDPIPQINHIYYLNLEKNLLRKNNMESWLQDVHDIPHKRINAMVGEAGVCVEQKNTTRRCRGTHGIVKTLTSIIDNENTTGITMVLEDDVVPISLHDDFERLHEVIKIVPDDWDIIRLDCWGMEDYKFKWPNSYVIDTSVHWWEDTATGNFCGGAYAMLWKDTGVQKLKKMWNKMPLEDADCVIVETPEVRSYCVVMGMWDHLYMHNELSDVSMLRD